MRSLSLILTSLFFTLNAFAIEAIYTVPTIPELEDINDFTVTDLAIEQDAEGLAKVAYSLPESLTGLKLPTLEFTRPAAGSNILVGDFGELECTANINMDTECTVIFNEIYKDLLEALDPLIEKKMKERIKDPTELVRVKALWEGFAGDPLGILSFSTCAQ